MTSQERELLRVQDLQFDAHNANLEPAMLLVDGYLVSMASHIASLLEGTCRALPAFYEASVNLGQASSAHGQCSVAC